MSVVICHREIRCLTQCRESELWETMRVRLKLCLVVIGRGELQAVGYGQLWSSAWTPRFGGFDVRYRGPGAVNVRLDKVLPDGRFSQILAEAALSALHALKIGLYFIRYHVDFRPTPNRQPHWDINHIDCSPPPPGHISLLAKCPAQSRDWRC
jgi:hypothetical protein